MPLAASASLREVSSGVLRGLVGHPVQLPLEAGHLLLEGVLALAHHLRAPQPIRAGVRQVVHIVGDVLLFLRNLLGLANGVAHVALGPVTLRALQLALRFAQPLGRGRGLPLRAGITIGGRTAHGIGRIAQLSRRVGQILPVLVARETLELPRRFLRLLGERALQLAAVAARRLPGGHAALPFELLFLPPGEFLQLLGELVDALVACLLIGPLAGLVLVRHAIQFHLEQVRQVLRDGPRAATAPAPAVLLGLDLQFEFLFGLLQQLQRPLFGRQRAVRALALELPLRRLHRLGGLGQQLRDLLERGIRRHQPAVHPLDQPLNLLAQAVL
jgi:hypothetical protein